MSYTPQESLIMGYIDHFKKRSLSIRPSIGIRRERGDFRAGRGKCFSPLKTKLTLSVVKLGHVFCDVAGLRGSC